MTNTDTSPAAARSRFAIGIPYTFKMVRNVDATGISGTGTVAEGCVFADGTTVIRWLTEHRSTSVYANAREAQIIHGHGGMTLFKYDQHDGREALACSGCGHAWGGHVLDNASLCCVGNCECGLSGSKNKDLHPVGAEG